MSPKVMSPKVISCMSIFKSAYTQQNSYSISHYTALLLHGDWKVTV